MFGAQQRAALGARGGRGEGELLVGALVHRIGAKGGLAATLIGMEREEFESDGRRRIAHLDMDAFYASVELLRRPDLQGAPVVIGGGRRRAGADGAPAADARLGDYVGRGVITTATYPARAFGLRSGMGLMQAARLCPEAILLPMDFEEYRRHSRRFKAIVRAIAPCIEDRGIDEIYIDVTDLAGVAGDGGRALAAEMQRAIRADSGLGCSIGVAPNKLLAKLASELEKPAGITILHESDLAARIWPLPCRRINGIGPKAAARLETLGVRTIGELAGFARERLVDEFGRSAGAWLHDAAWGRDERPVVTVSEPVSMSCETTFERDLHAARDRAELGAIFTRLCERLAGDLRRRGYRGRTIGVKLRFQDFRSITRATTVPHPSTTRARSAGWPGCACGARRSGGRCDCSAYGSGGSRRAPRRRRARCGRGNLEFF